MKREVIGRQELRWQLETAGELMSCNRKAPRQEGQIQVGVQERTCCQPEQTLCCEHAGENAPLRCSPGSQMR